MTGFFRRAALLGLLLAASQLSGCALFDFSSVETVPKPRPRGAVVQTAQDQIGTPYRAGGDNPAMGFDCSGLVQWCYAAHGFKLPRRTQDLLEVGFPVSRDELVQGDLVFFNVSRKRWGLHVGIYSGKGRFIHSPTPGSRVREESLWDKYWVRHYIGARRILR